MKRIIFALLSLIDFIESIPYQIIYAVSVAWLVLTWPIVLLWRKWKRARL